jgi:hypothetical protein
VPLDGSLSYAELAEGVNLPEALVRRILRHAMTNHIFAENPLGSGHIVHTSTSAFVARNPIYKSWIGHNLEEVTPAAMKLPDALRKFSMGKATPAQELEETAFSLAFSSKTSLAANFWDSLSHKVDGKSQADRASRFAEAMQVVHGTSAFDFPRLLKSGFDWESLGEGTVVDVSGLRIAKLRDHTSEC